MGRFLSFQSVNKRYIGRKPCCRDNLLEQLQGIQWGQLANIALLKKTGRLENIGNAIAKHIVAGDDTLYAKRLLDHQQRMCLLASNLPDSLEKLPLELGGHEERHVSGVPQFPKNPFGFHRNDL